jgi:hypothetical protein
MSTESIALDPHRASALEPADMLASEDRAPALVEKFVIRLPSGLRDRIRQLSELNRRSMNSEIIMVLENHIRQKFMEQMAGVNPDGGHAPGQRPAEAGRTEEGRTEAELNRMLESLPPGKKEALLELLG